MLPISTPRALSSRPKAFVLQAIDSSKRMGCGLSIFKQRNMVRLHVEHVVFKMIYSPSGRETLPYSKSIHKRDRMKSNAALVESLTGEIREEGKNKD
jgi:hypothetical protein